MLKVPLYGVYQLWHYINNYETILALQRILCRILLKCWDGVMQIMWIGESVQTVEMDCPRLLISYPIPRIIGLKHGSQKA